MRLTIVTRCGALLLALWAGGCAHDTNQASNGKASKVAPAVPWTVRVGAKGGFTGGGSGELIHSDGTVQSWSQIVPEDTVELKTLGHADPKVLQALEAAMTDPSLLAVQQQQQGNMPGFLEWSQAAEFRRWSWAERADSLELAPPLQRAYRAALDAAQSAQPAPKH
jgi:hypothetical protein